ncbi:chymotrypsin-1-like [Mya arenaria]|uniref:chymotrypsin-1-like n=1 Tax=Mya arenaria TaxID=6604 RepID=UPI0022DFAA7D|nr:chymotrypsin-1-like [Mya arenaria]
MLAIMSVRISCVSVLLPLVAVISGSQIKIINGEDAAPMSHPHQVSLQWNILAAIGFPGERWFHICGGSVIRKNVVLTAAHCAEIASKPAELKVVVNDHRLFDVDDTEQSILVKEIILHEDYIPGQDYDNSVYPNDIALLRLVGEVADSSSIIQIDTEEDRNRTGQTCIITGWGLNDTNSATPNILQQREMKVISEKECEELWDVEDSFIFKGHVCVFDGPNNTTGGAACSGDSGGPLVCDGVLVGVTSWGRTGCRVPETGEFLPSVYARVSYYYGWIQTTLQRWSIGRG